VAELSVAFSPFCASSRCRSYAVRCLSAAALVPSFRRQLPMMVTLLTTMVKVDARAVQQEVRERGDTHTHTLSLSLCLCL
jgi:hypothetical protein